MCNGNKPALEANPIKDNIKIKVLMFKGIEDRLIKFKLLVYANIIPNAEYMNIAPIWVNIR